MKSRAALSKGSIKAPRSMSTSYVERGIKVRAIREQGGMR